MEIEGKKAKGRRATPAFSRFQHSFRRKRTELRVDSKGLSRLMFCKSSRISNFWDVNRSFFCTAAYLGRSVCCELSSLYNLARMRNTLLLIALLFSALSPASAQSAKLGSACDLSQVFGAGTTQSFLMFDKELRQSIAKQNSTALALLVDFPLRINTIHGAYSIDDAQELKAQFQTIFPLKLRQAILDQKISELFCNAEGISYGPGSIWVNLEPFGYAIETVNLETVQPTPPNARIVFSCKTPKHRILIESDEKGSLQYLSWNAGDPVTGNPSLILNDGKEEWSGSDICSVSDWTFKHAELTYSIIGGGGCFDPEDAPPTGSNGELEVDAHGKTLLTEWCY